MALFHKAILSPSKAELIAHWLPTQRWSPNDDPINIIGAYRFDDPEGQVGMETFLVESGETLLHVPITYRAEPVEGAEESLVGQMEHSALGTRWVYDGLGDARYRVMLAAVTLTGQGEALGMVFSGDEWFIAPTNVRIRGGGWTLERVSADGFEAQAGDGITDVFRNDRFELTVYRRPMPGTQPSIGLTATWDGGPGRVVLAEIQER